MCVAIAQKLKQDHRSLLSVFALDILKTCLAKPFSFDGRLGAWEVEGFGSHAFWVVLSYLHFFQSPTLFRKVYPSYQYVWKGSKPPSRFAFHDSWSWSHGGSCRMFLFFAVVLVPTCSFCLFYKSCGTEGALFHQQ